MAATIAVTKERRANETRVAATPDSIKKLIGMGFAATGHLNPVHGAILQEAIDILSVLNALRAAMPPKVIHDLQ